MSNGPEIWNTQGRDNVEDHGGGTGEQIMTDDMDARARVKRLEAALRETRERISPYINMGTIRHGFDLLVKIDKALATSPPESEPEPDAVVGMRAIGMQFRDTHPAPDLFPEEPGPVYRHIVDVG